MNFATLNSLTIPEGEVSKITANGIVLWEYNAPTLVYTDLVPAALAPDGTVLDGVGYRQGAIWNGSTLQDWSAFTAVGCIPIDGSVSHDIYVYGLDFTGTSYNRYHLFTDTFSNLAGTLSLKEGISDDYIASVAKLADNYYKITTNTYSNKVKYFALSAATINGMKPIVTMDEPIR